MKKKKKRVLGPEITMAIGDEVLREDLEPEPLRPRKKRKKKK